MSKFVAGHLLRDRDTLYGYDHFDQRSLFRGGPRSRNEVGLIVWFLGTTEHVRLRCVHKHFAEHCSGLEFALKSIQTCYNPFLDVLDMADSGQGAEKKQQKRIPLIIGKLLDVAVYSFGSMKGLRDDHRIQSTEVVDGVCLMFSDLLANAKKEVKDEFELLRPRFGGWKPKQPPTRELFTFVQSRLKKWKQKKGFNKFSDPMMAPALIHFNESDEERENGQPKCWRCSSFCENCCGDKQEISFYAE